jgi:hypothetical protein
LATWLSLIALHLLFFLLRFAAEDRTVEGLGKKGLG